MYSALTVFTLKAVVAWLRIWNQLRTTLLKRIDQGFFCRVHHADYCVMSINFLFLKLIIFKAKHRRIALFDSISALALSDGPDLALILNYRKHAARSSICSLANILTILL